MVGKNRGGGRRGSKAAAEDGKRRSAYLECLIIVTIFAIPSAVFYLYVGAFQQPMVNMDKTQVMVVNMDNGTVGRQVEDAILATGFYQFQRANYSYAANAVSDGQEWAAIVIPPGFTQTIEDGGSARIVLLADDSSSYIVIRVLSPTIDAVVSSINVAVKLDAANRTSAAEDQVAMQEEAGAEQLSLLSNATGELGSGTDRLSAALGSGATGMSGMSSSEYGLAGAVQVAGAGAVNLHSGLVRLYNGSEGIGSGAESLYNGTSRLMTLNTQMGGVLEEAAAEAQASNDLSAEAYIYEAEQMASAEQAGLSEANAGANSLSAGAGSLGSGIRTAENATGMLAYTMEDVYPAVMYAANATGGASSSMSLASEETAKASSGASQISSSLGLVSGEAGQLSAASSQISAADGSLPGVSLVVQEENKSDYGTFFATAFVILGLFIGGSSAYLYSALGKLRRPLAFAMALVLVQCLVLAAVYSWMGFPMRGGEGPFVLVLFLAGAVFVLMTRLIASAVSPNLAHEHLTYLSPVLSLLAVFMISSGGVIWPSYTLQPPFSSFAPYIPFSYAVSGVRSAVLVGSFPACDLAALGAFCAAFLLATAGIGLLRRAGKGRKAS